MQKRLALLGSVILCCVTSFAAEQQPVGYFVEPVSHDDLDEPEADLENEAFCMRNGERVAITPGMEAYDDL